MWILGLKGLNSGGSRGGARETWPPFLFLDQTEARRTEKNFFWRPPPTPPPPPPSKDLNLALLKTPSKKYGEGANPLGLTSLDQFPAKERKTNETSWLCERYTI